MVAINAIKKSEVNFLRFHPRGPRMSVPEIAEYLSLNESLVASICAEEHDWTVIDKKKSMRIKKESDIDSDISIEENSKILNNEKLYENNEQAALWMEDVPISYMNELKMVIAIILAIAVLFIGAKMHMADYKDDTVKIDWPRFIHVCKVEFYEYLYDQLDITKENAEILVPIADEFYTKEHFREDWHHDLLKSIDYQRKVKEYLLPLKREVTVDFYTYKIPEYTIVQSINAFRIEFEDIRSRY